MTTVLLVLHMMIAAGLVGVVLLQRSEGGALGIGGGGGFMTGRSAGNALTKTTAILATAFFATSLTLTMLAGYHGAPTSIFGAGPGTTQAPAQNGLPTLQLPSGPPAPGSAPNNAAPSAPAAPSTPQPPQSK